MEVVESLAWLPLDLINRARAAYGLGLFVARSSWFSLRVSIIVSKCFNRRLIVDINKSAWFQRDAIKAFGQEWLKLVSCHLHLN